jgi:hypothetical protein
MKEFQLYFFRAIDEVLLLTQFMSFKFAADVALSDLCTIPLTGINRSSPLVPHCQLSFTEAYNYTAHHLTPHLPELMFPLQSSIHD